MMGKILENLNLSCWSSAWSLAIGLMMAPSMRRQAIRDRPCCTGCTSSSASPWIGLLYYFNFVQIPTMPAIPAELKPGVTKHIAPKALFYFRWGAAFTVLTGLILAWC